MRGISWFVDILHDRSKLLRLKLTNLFPNINFSGEKDSGKVLIIIIILFLIIIISPPTQCYNYERRFQNGEKAQGNHEAYAMWAFSSKYNKHHSIIIGRRWRYNETLQKK